MRSFPAGRGRRNLPPSVDQLPPRDADHAETVARPRRGDWPEVVIDCKVLMPQCGLSELSFADPAITQVR